MSLTSTQLDKLERALARVAQDVERCSPEQITDLKDRLRRGRFGWRAIDIALGMLEYF